MFKVYFYIALLLFSLSAQAHPVAFKDSLGIMGHHSPTVSHNQINYSFRHWFALGVHHFTRPDLQDNRHATFASSNFLLKRWNADNFQANIYGVLGAGQSELSGVAHPTGLGFLQFDIEDRKYYFLAKQMQLINEEQTDLRQTTVRAGIAPYLEKYDGIHSWLILEWQKMKFADSKETDELTPFLRVFYRNMLFEIGQSFKGATKFNYIAHF